MVLLHEHLVGTWVGEGTGAYPTITPFAYREVLEITTLPARPMATWRSVTTDGSTGEPRHGETGFLRSVGDGGELVLAHGFGVTEIAVGRWVDDAVLFESVSVAGTPTAKEVTAVVRSLRVVDDVLEYQLSMAAVGVPMTHHLSARLERS